MGGLEQKAIQLNRTRRRRTRWGAGLGVLVLVILVATAVGMQLPAFTQRRATYCGMDEDAGHMHELACYSNPEADVETEQDWVASLPQTLPEDGRERLVEVARSQLGYRESEDNYAVIEGDDVAGYTRYGAWDGAPYEPWNAAFARFCMHYAGVGEELGLAGDDAAAWTHVFADVGRYQDCSQVQEYLRPGDLVFFTDNNDQALTGIAEGLDADTGEVVLVAGDSGDEVRELRLAATDAHLLGFGLLVEEPEPAERPNSDVESASATETPEDAQDVTLTTTVDGMLVTATAVLPQDGSYALVAKRVAATDEWLREVEDCETEELPGGVVRRASVDASDALLLDLSIVDETGAEVEPAGAATVIFSQVTEDDVPAVVHFAEGGAEALEATPQSDGFSFQTESFSVYAFAFTVDFYYEGFEYHLPGEGQILLSDLFVALGIEQGAAEVDELTFSSPELVSVERQADDWLLTSLAPFDTQETLTAHMAGGDTYVVKVTDAKSYSFTFNVNDPVAGCVYASSKLHDSEFSETVSDTGTVPSVRPRSADNPTDSRAHATSGYYFVGWRRDGYIDFGQGSASTDNKEADLYSIQPTVGTSGVEDRAQTFTACFAPTGQHLITFLTNVADTPSGAGSYIAQGYANTYDYLGTDGNTYQAYYCYSGAAYGAVAVPGYGAKFAGWYRTDTDELVCESAWFVPPADLGAHITVQARFEQAALRTVTYHSVNAQGGGQAGYITVTSTGVSDRPTVTESVYDQHVPGGAEAEAWPDSTFVGWRIGSSTGRIVTRSQKLTSLEPISGDTDYYAEYLPNKAPRVLYLVRDAAAGRIVNGNNNYTDLLDGYDVANGTVNLRRTVSAVANDGYRFDHWELNGSTLSNTGASIRSLGATPNSTNPQELTAVFLPITSVTYDLSVLQYVGNNSADFQHWQDVPWCSGPIYVDSARPLTILGNDQYQYTTDYGSQIVLPDLVHNTPDGTQTIRVSQTNNGYNLLTHTFKGWRMVGDATKTIHPPETGFIINSPCTFEAVWDAYLPGKAGAYSSSKLEAPYRYNTNTCGFFVRLFDSSFDKGNTNTYTDCLFTSRIMVSGDSAFATNGSVNGSRLDFFGNSDATDHAQIEEIDQLLRSHAATAVPYTAEYNPNQDTVGDFVGSYITFEQSFPSDEFMFGRIREWNAAASEDRKIQVNGTVIPQSQLTPDFFELKWYVLKDQQNSWHVDGMLIPKYGQLVVKKRFEGDVDAVARNSDASRNFYIGVTESLGRTENNYSASITDSEYYKMEEIQLTLDEQDDGGRTVIETRSNGKDPSVSAEVTKYRYTYKDEMTGEYVWVLNNLEPFSHYYLGEHNYVDQQGCSTSKSWRLDNTQETTTSGTSYRLDKGVTVYSYPDGTPTAEVQTVSFTNRYTKPQEVLIAKLDATTGNPLADVVFDFSLKTSDESSPLFTLKFRTGSDGYAMVTLSNPFVYDGGTVSLPDGKYRFAVTEYDHAGYQALGTTLTGNLTFATNKPIDMELDSSITSNSTLKKLVYVRYTDTYNGDKYRPILYVENTSGVKSVEVTKRWTNNATTPVTMQLLRNNVPVAGAGMSVQLDASNDWHYEWNNLPAFVDGTEAIYTVREEWIGEAGGTDSVHYNTTADADGYEDYIVSQSQTVTTEDGVTVTHVNVENTPNSGQAVFTKVDDSQQAVPGAEFTVYVDEACSTPITASNYTNGTSAERPAVFVSDANGKVTIEGLNPGTYYLKETKVPSGYAMRRTSAYVLSVGSKTSSISYVDGNGNEVAVTQIENPVYSRRVTIRKTVAGTANVLQGAVFSLHGQTSTGEMDPNALYTYGNLVSGPDGTINLGNLKVGTYYLVEERAPVGFNKLESPVRITVPGDDSTALTAIKTISNTALPVSGGVITVPNSAGVVLPATGGVGNAPLYLGGTMLLALAADMLRRRRLRAKGGDRA